MALIDMIDRIDELLGAGAGTNIIRGQLTILRDQTEAMETRLTAFEANTQNESLQQENDRLRADLEAAKQEIDRIEGELVVENFTPPQEQHETRHPEIEEQILKGLPADIQRAINPRVLAQNFRIREEVFLVHLNHLKVARHADKVMNMGGPSLWWRTIAGAEYLFKHGLL
jgi:predicted nuclease with TOPRIM domain